MASAHGKYAAAASSNAAGKKPAATTVSVSSPSSPPARSSAILNSTAHNTRKIFVGGLHYGTVDSGLKRYFSSFGTVESAQVMYNRDTAKSRGFGFVVFTDEDAVDRVLDAGTYHELDDKEVEIKRSVPKSGQQTIAAKPVSAASAPVVAPAPVAAPAPVVSTPAPTDASKASVWKGKKETPVASKTISKGTSWVSAVVGNSTSNDNSVAPAQPTSSAAAPAPSIAPPLSSPHSSAPLTSPLLQSPHAPPAPTPATTHKPALAAPTALGLGMDIVGGSSIADLLKNSLPSSLPSPALSAASSTAIGAEKSENGKPGSPGGQAFGSYPPGARLPSELPSLLSLQSLGGPGGAGGLAGGLGTGERAGLRQGGRDASWDLADGTTAADSALGFSGGDSVVSTLTTEELEHDGLSGEGKGRRVRGVDLGLYPSLPTHSHGPPQAGMPLPMPLPHELAGNPFLGAGFPHSMFNSPVYQSFQSEAQSALLASMAAAALRMYQPWAGQAQAPIPPYAPQAAPLSMPPAFPAGPGGPPGLNSPSPPLSSHPRAPEHPTFQPFPAYHRL